MPSNPFSTRFIRPGAIPFIFQDAESASSVVQRLQAHQWCGQIVGRHGSGKSTLLATLIPALEAAGRRVVSVSLHQGEHRLPRLNREQFSSTAQLMIDGYEQLSWWSRWYVKMLCGRYGTGLLVTAHADAGLPTIYHTHPSEGLSQLIAARLLGDRNVMLDSSDIAAAYRASGGNLRETLFKLYDVYARTYPPDATNLLEVLPRPPADKPDSRRTAQVAPTS